MPQLELFSCEELEFAPEPLKRRLRGFHRRPLVSRGPGDKPIDVDCSQAMAFPFIQIGHNHCSHTALVLSCYNPRSIDLDRLPEPNWTSTDGQFSFLAWALAQPVFRFPGARPEPLAFYERIAESYAAKLDANRVSISKWSRVYDGLLSPNPVAESGFTTRWGRESPYMLRELGWAADFDWNTPRLRGGYDAISYPGRESALYRGLWAYAGRLSNRTKPLLEAARAINELMAKPLPMFIVQEAAGKAEAWRKLKEQTDWHTPAYRARKAAMGRKGGLKNKGMPKAGKLRSSASTECTNEHAKPWDDLGISRATWYRERQRGRT